MSHFTFVNALDDELKRLRAEFAEVKPAVLAQPDTHDYSETETPGYFSDLLLKEAGWPLAGRGIGSSRSPLCRTPRMPSLPLGRLMSCSRRLLRCGRRSSRPKVADERFSQLPIER